MKSLDFPKILPVAFCCAAAAGSAVAAFTVFSSRSQSLSNGALEARLVGMEQSLASTRQLLVDAESQMAELRSQQEEEELAPPPARVEVFQGDALDTDQMSDILARIEELELEVAASSHLVSPREFPENEDHILASQLARDSMLEYQHLFGDPEVSWSRRLDALRMLRKFPAQMEALNEGVVAGALEVLDGEDDQRKAQILDVIERIQDPRLCDEYLKIARDSKDERLRAEAVGALETFIDRSDVVTLLESLRDDDASDKIRRLAGRALD